MYTLRTVTASNNQINQSIGGCYSVINRDFNYTEFKDYFRDMFLKEHVADLDDSADEYSKNVYAFVIWFGEVTPLYKDSYYYIMTETGKTFSNLSYKI